VSNLAAILVTVALTVVLVAVPVLAVRLARRLSLHPAVALVLVLITLMPAGAWSSPARQLDGLQRMWRNAFDPLYRKEPEAGEPDES
jgi:hypothetical protein